MNICLAYCALMHHIVIIFSLRIIPYWRMEIFSVTFIEFSCGLLCLLVKLPSMVISFFFLNTKGLITH